MRTCVLIFILQLSGKPTGYDRVRNAEIGNKDFELDVLEEAYTSEHWIVRIYKVCWVVFVKKKFDKRCTCFHYSKIFRIICLVFNLINLSK